MTDAVEPGLDRGADEVPEDVNTGLVLAVSVNHEWLGVLVTVEEALGSELGLVLSGMLPTVHVANAPYVIVL